MHQDFSQASLGLSELSVFDKELPQGVQSLEVDLTPGVRVPLSASSSKQVKVPTRKYAVTVEPNGYTKKAKDVIREESKPVSHLDFRLQQMRKHAPQVEDFMDDRCVFRNERAKRFQVGHQFPALVTPRLIPSWRLSEAGQKSIQGDSTPRSVHGRGDATDFAKLTVSASLKQQNKRSQSSTTPWLASGTAGVGEIISNRKPTLYAEQYDSQQAIQRAEYNEAKERWVGESTVLPTSTAVAKVACDSRRPVLDSHIAAMRERGRASNESLKERYELKRQNYKKEREERGALSSFERVVRERERAEEEAAKKRSTAPEAKPEHPHAGLQSLQGLANFRIK